MPTLLTVSGETTVKLSSDYRKDSTL